MNAKWILPTALVASGLLAGCENSTHTQREAAGGAVAGAVIGGIIGSRSGDAAEGAAVGAAAGGAIGAAHGSSRDARQRDEGVGPYSSDDYRRLLTDDEVDILEARAEASGRKNYRLTDFLTEEEKENLRRRDRVQRGEIGS